MLTENAMRRKNILTLALVGATLALAAPGLASAQDLKALPGGGGLKDVPTFHDLPGVQMKLNGAGGAPQGNCVEQEVNAYDSRGYYEGLATETRCKFGRLSIGTVRSGNINRNSIPGMTQFHGHYHPAPQEYRPGN